MFIINCNDRTTKSQGDPSFHSSFKQDLLQVSPMDMQEPGNTPQYIIKFSSRDETYGYPYSFLYNSGGRLMRNSPSLYLLAHGANKVASQIVNKASYTPQLSRTRLAFAWIVIIPPIGWSWEVDSTTVTMWPLSLSAIAVPRPAIPVPTMTAFRGMCHTAVAKRKRKYLTFKEVSDDNFTISLPTRLVSVAALLKRYSPSPHPLLRLLSHVPALTYNN